MNMLKVFAVVAVLSVSMGVQAQKTCITLVDGGRRCLPDAVTLEANHPPVWDCRVWPEGCPRQEPVSPGYTLITVTYGGDVGHSRGYQTLRMCEQAKSMALTGMTIEQNETADIAFRKQEEEREAAFRAKHPPRKPTAEERKTWKPGNMGCGSICVAMDTDGLMHESPGLQTSGGFYLAPGEEAVWSRGGMVRKARSDVKHAECVTEAKP